MHRRTRLLVLAAAATAAIFLLASVARAGGQRDIGREMEEEFGVLARTTTEGARLNEAFDDVVHRIVQGVNTSGEHSDFSLKGAKILGGKDEKHDAVVNAFALPDGRIYVTLGLLRLIRGDANWHDQLAFVVGHEVTHVVERHGRSQARRSLPALVLAGILGAVTKSKTVEQIGGLGAAAYASKFSRQDEYRADRGGLMAMYYARYELCGAVRMLEHLGKQSGKQSSLLNGWFGSHPLTENRINRVKAMIRDLESGKKIVDRSEAELEKEDREAGKRKR